MVKVYKMKQIDYDYIANEYYELMKDKADRMEDIGYPLDIIHDITYILQEKPEIFFIFCKKYISTHILDVTFDHKDKQKSLNHLDLFDYHERNLSDYSFCLLYFKGKYHEYDLSREWNKENIKTLLRFFKKRLQKDIDRYCA